MQNQRYIYPVDLTELNQKIQMICERMKLSKAEAIRDAIDFYHNYLMGLKVIELRKVSRNLAEKEILNYIRHKGSAWTSEIADDLRLDVVMVDEVLRDLARRDKIK